MCTVKLIIWSVFENTLKTNVNEMSAMIYFENLEYCIAYEVDVNNNTSGKSNIGFVNC